MTSCVSGSRHKCSPQLWLSVSKMLFSTDDESSMENMFPIFWNEVYRRLSVEATVEFTAEKNRSFEF